MHDPFGESRTSTARQEDQFGKNFGEAYRANPNSTPLDVVEGDVVPVSLTTEPMPIG